MGDALIAHHLAKRGVTCYLEPLETWQSAVYAYEPHFILFNHLTVKHLADFSQVLKSWGILVGSLLNEGLLYGESARSYCSQKQYENVHCDLFLTWNEAHREALVEHEFCNPPEMAQASGCPRFDFYQPPWCDVYKKSREEGELPVVLVNATFALAHFYTLPRENADSFFAQWRGKMEGLSDYWALVEAHYNGRQRVPSYITPLIKSGKYRVIIRPNPREELAFYHDWIASLEPGERELVSISTNESPPVAIFKSDVILNCEDCTTCMEAWLAGKPTLTIALERHPYWLTDTYKRLSPIAESADQLREMIESAMQNPEQTDYRAPRLEHLEKWLYSTDGRSAERAAEKIADLIKSRDLTPRVPFSVRGQWKKWKLLVLGAFDEPYRFRPKHYLRRRFSSKQEQVSLRYMAYLKSIRRSEVTDAANKIIHAEKASSGDKSN